MRTGPAVLLAAWFSALVAAGCSSEPAPAEPQGEEHLEFRGVDKSREPELRELVARDLQRYLADPRDTALEDAAFRLRYHYQFDGYADVHVDYERTPTKVIFKIEEGARITFGRIHFYGNTTVPTEELKAARPRGFLGESVPYSDRLVAALRDQILAEYGRRGFIEAEVDVDERRTPEDPDRVHVSFTIKEGRRFLLQAIDGPPLNGELWLKLARYILEPYTPGTVETVEATTIDYLRDHGYPYAQATGTPEIDRARARVRIALEVRPGAWTEIGEVRLRGNEVTRDSFVLQRANLRAGEEYRYSDLRKAEERLQATRLYRSARVAPAGIDDDTGRLAIDVAVEEREAGEVSFRAGYGSLDGPRGGADLSYANLFGGAELGRIGATVSALGYRGDAELGFPYFLGTDLRPGVTGWYERREFPSFNTTSEGTLGTLQFPFTEKFGLEGGVRYAIIRTDHVEPGVPPGDLLDFAYTALLLSAKLDLLDNPRLPTEGLYATVEADWSPESFRSDVVFVSASGRVSGYVPLPWDLVLATSFQGGIILPRGKTDEIPISLRYFAGGESSVRGFKVNTVGSQISGEPSGGEVYMALQSEIRFPIWSELHGAVFSDQGGVWFNHNQVDLNEIRWSVGLGLRYYTAAGAFVLDAGWNPRREKGEKTGDISFSIGFPF